MREIVNDLNKNMIESINHIQKVCYSESYLLGWHNDPKTGLPRTAEENDERFPLRIALCHSELSEAMEGHRKGLMDDHLPHRLMAEVELADAIIRVFDLANTMGYDMGTAIFEKLEYNRERKDHKMENRMKEGGKKYSWINILLPILGLCGLLYA